MSLGTRLWVVPRLLHAEEEMSLQGCVSMACVPCSVERNADDFFEAFVVVLRAAAAEDMFLPP